VRLFLPENIWKKILQRCGRFGDGDYVVDKHVDNQVNGVASALGTAIAARLCSIMLTRRTRG
jgi:hypothetical protein